MIEGTVSPVKVSVTIGRPPADVFRVFTEEIEKWWPIGTHSIAATALDGKVRTVAVHLEGRVGGRIYERMSDGKEATWGTIRIWEPPSRILFSWKPNFRPESPTEVEVHFVPQGMGTRVDLEHRGWEGLGEAGVERRTGYETGWRDVLGVFAGTVDTANR